MILAGVPHHRNPATTATSRRPPAPILLPVTSTEIVVDKDVVEGRKDPVRVYADKAKEVAGDAA